MNKIDPLGLIDFSNPSTWRGIVSGRPEDHPYNSWGEWSDWKSDGYPIIEGPAWIDPTASVRCKCERRRCGERVDGNNRTPISEYENRELSGGKIFAQPQAAGRCDKVCNELNQ